MWQEYNCHNVNNIINECLNIYIYIYIFIIIGDISVCKINIVIFIVSLAYSTLSEWAILYSKH